MIHKIITVVSLLLVLGTAVLWVRSYGTYTILVPTSIETHMHRHEWRDITRVFPGWHGYTKVGSCCAISLDLCRGGMGLLLQWVREDAADPVLRDWIPDGCVGFAFQSFEMSGVTMVTAFAPCWAVFGLFAIQPIYMFIRGPVRRWRRRRQGRCLTCGDNLTGNVSGICPECGTAIAREGPPIPPV